MSIVPDCKEWAQKFIRDMPWFGFRDSRYHWYGEDFYLDIAEIEKLSTFRYRIPTNSEFAAMVHGLPPDKVKGLADEMANSHRQALLAYKAEEVLEKLDENPVETVSQLNDALCALVVRPGDDQYEDFHFPSFRII